MARPRTAIAGGLVAVALLGALAGCSGVLDPGGSDAGTTPTATTADATTVAVDEDFVFPPGISAAGLTDPDALLRAHREAMAGSGFAYTFEHTMNETDRTHDEDLGATIDVAGEVRATAGLETVQRRRVDRDDDPTNTTTVWFNGTVGGQRVEGETTGYRSYDGDPTPRLTHHYMVAQVVLRGEWEVTEVRENESLVVLEAHVAPEHGDLVSFDAEMVVDGEGRIRRLETEIKSSTIEERQGETAQIIHERHVVFEVTAVGNVSVPPPEWLDEATDGDG